MRHPASRIAAPLTAAVSLGAFVCCQQILGLDEGKPGAGSTASAGGAGSTASAGGATTSTGGASTSSGTTSSGTGGGTSSSSTASSSTSTSSTGGVDAGCTLGVTVTMANLIDDMEEGSGSIIQQGNRTGSWFTYNDGTPGGMQTPTAGGACLPVLIPGGRCGSANAMHTFGSGFTSYGMGIGFDLNHGAGARLPYDVSTFTGIAFWAKGPQIGLQVQVVEEATAPTSQGGTCTTGCNAHYFQSVNLGAGWQPVTVDFSKLKQPMFGTQVPWSPAQVLGVQFAVNPAPLFDFWIDDVGFY